jgi:hypothetical protein
MNKKNLHMILNLLKILKAQCSSLTRFVYIKYHNVFQGEALLNNQNLISNILSVPSVFIVSIPV